MLSQGLLPVLANSVFYMSLDHVRLKGGHEDIPKGLDTGAYIVSLGSNHVPVTAEPSKTPDFEAQQTLTVESVIERYIKLRTRLNEESYLHIQRCHLGRFSRYLKSKNVESLVDVTESTLDDFLWGCLEGKKRPQNKGTALHRRVKHIGRIDSKWNTKQTG